MEEELRAHIAHRADDLERSGVTRRKAARRAMKVGPRKNPLGMELFGGGGRIGQQRPKEATFMTQADFSSTNIRARKTVKPIAMAAAVALLLLPLAAVGQTASSTADKWIHVRVTSADTKGESVKVNVPLDMAEKVLPAINKDRLHNGKVRIDKADMNGVDVRAILDAVRTAKDGEFVTVQAPDADVRVAKEGGFLLIHVLDKSEHHGKAETKGEKEAMANVSPHRLEIKVPMKVVDALFSAGDNELDLVAALRALSSSGDTELVSVKDNQNTVRVWIDSKNLSD
jgi:hypothetical protein